MVAPFSLIARSRKARFFEPYCKPSDAILDVGCGSGWWEAILRSHGFTNVTGLDLEAPAAIVGDIRDWRKLGMQAESFDVITIFEVFEHVDAVEALWSLLKPGGRLMVTTPIPESDWILLTLEAFCLTQPRVSAHSHLTDIATIPGFRTVVYKRVLGLAQWGVYEKV